MSKLPRGMFKRGKSYVTRERKGGVDKWTSHGADFALAVQRHYELMVGRALPTPRLTVKDAAQHWLANYVATARNEKNQHDAATRVASYLAQFLGHRHLSRLTGGDFREYRLWLEQKGLSPQTVAHVLSDARCFSRWCDAEGYVPKSPFPPRLLPRIQERPPDRHTDEEVETLLAVEEPYRFAIRLGLATGLRWGELCQVQRADLERDMLLVRKSKSGKVRRVPFIEADVLSDVRGRVGKLVPFSKGSVGSFDRRVRGKTGLEGFHVHRLRHTFSCRWLERGGSLVALQHALGHASIVTTQRYARLTDDQVRAEAQRLARGVL